MAGGWRAAILDTEHAVGCDERARHEQLNVARVTQQSHEDAEVVDVDAIPHALAVLVEAEGDPHLGGHASTDEPRDELFTA